jgi:argininosuccinate lyase
MVRYCEENGTELADIPVEALASIDERLTADILPSLTVEAALAAHAATGGTSPTQVALQLDRVRSTLADQRAWALDYRGPRFDLGVIR